MLVVDTMNDIQLAQIELEYILADLIVRFESTGMTKTDEKLMADYLAARVALELAIVMVEKTRALRVRSNAESVKTVIVDKHTDRRDRRLS